jgi:hypothetical protein
MQCNELVELVTDYLEEALSVRDRARFTEHMSLCAGCAIYVEQLRVTLAVLGRIEPEDLSPEAERGLVAAFRGWRRERGAS